MHTDCCPRARAGAWLVRGKSGHVSGTRLFASLCTVGMARMGREMTGKLVTVFGGSGFIGRQVAQELLARGARVRIAVRNTQTALGVKPLGGLGQTQIVSADVTRPESVARAVAGADAVINLVGILKGRFQRVQAEGAAHVARAAAQAGVKTLVHVSAIGADAHARSAYGRSKGEGEAAVRGAFPAAAIIRPSLVFGRDDGFTNRFAALMGLGPVMPVVAGQTRFQPVFVGDVARAVALAALDPAYAGRTFELGGPQQLSMRKILGEIARMTDRKPNFVAVPGGIAGLMAMLTGWMPGAPLTSDQWKMLQSDNVVADGSEGLEAFGITPTPLGAVAEGWLVTYRKQGRFGRRVEA